MLEHQDHARHSREQPSSTTLCLVAHELSRLNIDIAALRKVRFPDTGSLKEQGAGYTLHWSGKSQGERRLSGVGFMIKNNIAAKLENLPTGHSDRIISMRPPLRKEQYVTLFSVYAPTLQADTADKDKFYTDLQVTRLLSLGTSTLEWAEIQMPGKEFSGNMA